MWSVEHATCSVSVETVEGGACNMQCECEPDIRRPRPLFLGRQQRRTVGVAVTCRTAVSPRHTAAASQRAVHLRLYLENRLT